MTDHDEQICTSSPPILQVPLSVQMQKALSAEEPRESRKSRETPGTVLETLREKKKIPMNYFCRGKMTEAHVHDVCFSNRTMSPSEKAHLLPQYLRILYEERRKMMEWVSDKLKRRIWIYARGEKIYKHSETGSLVEQFTLTLTLTITIMVQYTTKDLLLLFQNRYVKIRENGQED
jgi:hypothetical protein